MTKNDIHPNGPKSAGYYLRAGTALALVTLVSGAGATLAQTSTVTTNPGAAPAAVTGGAKSDDTVVVITGTRASERSSIDRKKKAKTATDSIVAEDVGKFPDKNIGEAISRIAGVAVDRGNFNEGGEVTLRGVSSGQTNVEIDGMGVQDTTLTNNLAFGGTSDGRGKTLSDYPADLIKSVDVVKGSTAAMTEGGIGGSIIINTRTGLDFKKPFVSLRYDETQNSLGQTWTPEWNLIMARKFLGGRLGILVNYSNSVIYNDNDQIQPQTSGTQGLARSADFDNSPNKTFTYNPSTVSTTDLAGYSTPVATGSSSYTFDTPLSLITKSAAAKTKADCYAAFPALTTTQLAGFGAATSTQAATARTAQTNELITCLNQWNDYTPSLVRNFVNRDIENRQALDLRADFKVSDDLTVFAKLSIVKNDVNNTQQTFTEGGFAFNPASISTPTFNGVPYTDNATTLTRSAVAGSGYTTYDGVSVFSTPAGTATTGSALAGVAVDVPNDGTLKVDASHHVIQATVTDATINTDQIHNTNNYFSKYVTTGGHFHHDGFTADLLLGDAVSKYTRYDRRTNLSYSYGPALMQFVSGNGLWTITPTNSNFSQTDPSLYSIVRPATAALAAKSLTGADPGISGQTGAYTVAQQPLVSASMGLQWSPKESDTEEKRGKFDMTYDFHDRLPFVKTIAAGLEYNEDISKGWAAAGITVASENTHNGTTPFVSDGNGGHVNNGYIPPVVLPTMNLRGTVRACTPSTAAGALPCNYGYVANSALSNDLYGTETLTPTDFQSIVSQAFIPQWYTFMNGLPQRGDLLKGWAQLDVDKIYNLVSAMSKNTAYASGGDPLANYNFNCIKVCKASDGNSYAMPFSAADEKTNAGYFMMEFEQKLPFGMTFNGNLGQRYVKTDVNATGYVSVSSIVCNSTANCTTATNTTNGTTSYTASAPVAVVSNTTDWMPSYNYNLWLLEDKLVFRYYGGRVIARPPITQLLPGGTCTIDQRTPLSSDGSVTGTCGTFGNPGLKPFKSRNHNWSLEYYPNKDDQFSVGLFKNQVITNSGIAQSVSGNHLFAGLNVDDPASGAALNNQEFTYTTYVNGPSLTRHGTEYAAKLAFTFLPWYLKYLGLDANYATVHSSNAVVGVVDLITGTQLPPVNESSYYGNISLWYDDGTTNVRFAYQARDFYFRGIAPEGNANTVNNYPANGVIARPIPFNIGSPNFQAATGYLDFKINHKMNANYEVFFQANNILKEHTQQDQQNYNAYSDGSQVVNNFSYPGYRVTVGFTVRN